MNNSQKFELLSAYLDEEVSLAEQAQAEQLLQGDPQARQLLEELSQLGDMLRHQPAERMRPSFTSDVMDRVRQQPAFGTVAATEDQSSVQPEATHKHVTLPGRGQKPGSGKRNYRRPLLWSTLAAAAALMVLAYPLGLFDFFDNPADNRIAVEEEEQQDGELVANGTTDDHAPQAPNSEQLVGQPDREPNGSPRTEANGPSAPGPGMLVELPLDPPDLGPAVPNQTPNAPFVGSFNAEDEKILRLLESLVLVKIECTPAAANAREFDKILKKYKIKLAEKATPKRAADAPVPETEVYYIEASAKQAEAVLNEVSSRSNEFTSMTLRTETQQTKNAFNLNTDNDQVPAPGSSPSESDPAPADDTQQPVGDDDATSSVQPPTLNRGRGSFAEKFHLETPEELAALRNNPRQPPSASSMLPLLHGQADLDTILGASPVDAEHLVRMLVVLDTVKPKQAD
jgi:hypothetical protein